MGALLVYVVKSAVCLALLFAGYRLWLRSETLHGMNRATLLGICVASLGARQTGREAGGCPLYGAHRVPQ